MHMAVGFITLLLFLISSRDTFQQFAGCRESYYLYEGSCTPCPDRCAACSSDLNCTKCNNNHYGPVCQYTCQQECEYMCHKVHGYCTYGCEEGLFPDPPLCTQCPKQCKICKSMTECMECLPGYYGNTCEIRCSNGCKMCYKTTGACLVCDEGYYNQDGQCQRCRDGCAVASETRSLLHSTGDLEGNKMSHDCTNTRKGQRFMLRTRKSCIQYITCSPNMICPAEYERKSACGTIKTYQCSQSCHGVNESYSRCKPNDTLIEENLASLSFCIANEGALSVIKLSADSECVNVTEETPTATSESCTAYILFLILLVVVMMLLCASVVLNILWMKRYRTSRESRKDAKNDEEYIDLKSANGAVNREGEQEKSAVSQSESGLNHTSNDSVKIDVTSNLNRSASIDEPFSEGKTSSSVSVRQSPYSSTTNVNRNRRDNPNPGFARNKSYLGRNVFSPLMQNATRPKWN